MTKQVVQLIEVKNTLSAKVLQNVEITKGKHPSKKNSKQIDKYENNINKQLIEIRHNKHRIYLQSKNLKGNRNQSNNKEHQDVHQ